VNRRQERTFLTYATMLVALLLLSGSVRPGAWLRHYLNPRRTREGNHPPSQQNPGHGFQGEHRGASNEELRNAARGDAIIGETLEVRDGAIEAEERRPSARLELFAHAVAERRACGSGGYPSNGSRGAPR